MCLYSPHKAECAKVQLLDTVIMDGTEIAAYLFTSREGAVKKKSKRQLGRGLGKVGDEFVAIANAHSASAGLDELARRWRAAHSLTAPRRPPPPKTRRRVRSRR